MSKRKKKNRKTLARSAFGLNSADDKCDNDPLCPRSFQEGDFLWLADEYQRQTKSNPSLSLEEFAGGYGVPADELRYYIPDVDSGVSHSIILWHGTTGSRAESISEQGFRAKKGHRHGIFFTRIPSVAANYARNRARNEDDDPAVIMCSIDLAHYVDYERKGTSVFAFRYNCIASDVVRKVTKISRSEKGKPNRNIRIPAPV